MSRNLQHTGYCTNVHAGADLAKTRANLERYALDVKRQVSPNEPMGVGLWLTALAARQMRAEAKVAEFGDWLAAVGLTPFTFNGFPYGDFHEKIVKHRVYEPTWADRRRVDYTLDLIAIQHALLPAGMEGSISTLPICWGSPRPSDDFLNQAGRHLAQVAEHLAELERETGRLIYICIEPEPGCLLQRKGDFLWFFQHHLWPLGDETILRRHLRVCHDVCHSVVMFEPQEDVLRGYREAGILVGKVQVSSAIQVDFAKLVPEHRIEAVAQLRAFAEDRYLHQTMVREPGGEPVFHEDLPELIASCGDPRTLTSEWRIHFHVPIYLENFGRLSSSRDDIEACLAACRKYSEVRHFEVETYAWGVLPAELRRASLADGVAEEMRWFWGRERGGELPSLPE